MNNIPIFITPSADRTRAEITAQRFQLTLIEQLSSEIDLYLQLDEQGLGLCQQSSKFKPVYVDFIGGRLGFRRQRGGGRQQPLARAVGIKSKQFPYVIDATAGLGRDAFVLACLGCQVQMVERVPAIAALLADGLQRGQADAEIGSMLGERLQLLHMPTQQVLPELLAQQPKAVLYLDPMYPHRQKSALVKKEMRLFRQLVGDDVDAAELLQLALQLGCHRTVVKRPNYAEPLGEIAPSMSIEGETTRYDLYLR